MPSKVRNCFCGIFAILFSIVFFMESLKIKSLGYSEISASFFPKFFCIILFILGSFLTAINLRSTIGWIKSNKNKVENGWFKKLLKNKLFLSILLVIAYLPLIDEIGFVVSSVLYLFFQILVFSKEVRGSRLKALIAALSTTAVVYAVFTFLLQINLPAGLLI